MPPPGAVAPMPPPGPPQPPEDHPGADRGVVEDAASSSSFLAPTALTAPKGTWWFSDVDLFLITAGYAITNEFQVSATTLIPVTSDVPAWGLFNGKLQVLKQGHLRLAAQAALTFIRDSSTTTTFDSMGNPTGSTSTHNTFFAGDVGGAGTYCFDDGCGSHASLFAGVGFAEGSSAAAPLFLGASIAAKLNRHVKFIGEVDTGYVLGHFESTSNAFLVWYGARFTSRNIGVDFGFVKPFFDGESTGNALPLGFPYLGFTYRSIDD